MKLFLYRLSLTQSRQPLLFDDPNQAAETRVDFLKRNFSKGFKFEYRKGIKLKYQHTQTDQGAIAGAICRWISEDVESDPDDPFAVSESGRWEKSAFFFNIFEDEQVFGIEQNPKVGLPQSVMTQLCKTVNAITQGTPYTIDVFSLNTSKSFRQAVLEHPGPITSLQFDLVIPNPTNAEGKTKAALKKLRKITNGERFKSTTTSKEGLNVDNPLTRDAAKYAENGGGDIVAKSDRVKVFDSRKRARSVEISDDLYPDGNVKNGLWSIISDKLKR